MKILKSLTVLLASAFFFTAFAQAQMQPGAIRVFATQGNDVVLTDNTTGQRYALTRGQTFGQGYSVETGPSSSVFLVFSNGSAVNVGPDSKFNVDEFMQAPYDQGQGQFLRLRSDPSRSVTNLSLNYGEVAGRVRQLQPASDYRISTPAGSAGIRGTRYTFEQDGQIGTFSIISSSLDQNIAQVVNSYTGEQFDANIGQSFVLAPDGTQVQPLDPGAETLNQQLTQALQNAGDTGDDEGPFQTNEDIEDRIDEAESTATDDPTQDVTTEDL